MCSIYHLYVLGVGLERVAVDDAHNLGADGAVEARFGSRQGEKRSAKKQSRYERGVHSTTCYKSQVVL